MEPERIALSQRERDRLKVLHEVEQKQVTQVEAGRRLDLTDRHIRRLLVRLHQRGDGALVHRLRGQPSNCRRRSRGEFWRAYDNATPISGPPSPPST